MKSVELCCDSSKVCHNTIRGESKEQCRDIPFIVVTIMEKRIETYIKTLDQELFSNFQLAFSFLKELKSLSIYSFLFFFFLLGVEVDLR